MSNYAIAIVEDTVHVLETFLARQDGLTLAEITRQTGLSKNKVFRVLYTLEQHRLVERTGAGLYRLGLRFLDFGQHVQEQMGLLEAAQVVMDGLLAETNETVFLGIVDGREALCIDARESPQSIRLFARIGRRAPLYAGGVPKVLLAFLPPQTRDSLVDAMDLRPITPYTITDKQRLRAELQRIRQQGYVVTANDLDEGAVSIAVPIRDRSGRVVAAISVAGPAHRFHDEQIERYRQLLHAGAAQISHRLGYIARTTNGSGVLAVQEPARA